MTPDFNVADHTTWPPTLTVDHVAAIKNRKPGGIARACASHTFKPAPYERRPHYLWRKEDVLRDVAPASVGWTSPLRKASGF